MKAISKKIVDTALSFVGQTEIGNNEGWKDSNFEKLMEAVGWKTGQAWCSYFSEAVYTLAYDKAPFVSKLFSGSAVRTFDNFEKAGYQVSAKPQPGAVVVWQTKRKGVLKWTGHAGIVVEVHKDYFVSVEGNTNGEGVREGDVVAKRKRTYNFDIYQGLQLKGFILPPDLQKKDQDDSQPFKNKKEGNKFRRWVNDEHPDVAKEVDLDRSGAYNNSYILKAYEILKEIYTA